MRILNAITTTLILLILTLSVTGCGNSATAYRKASELSEPEKHQLYSAALAAAEAPLDSEVFKDVCRKIGIFDAAGRPNNNYMTFVSAHVGWAMKDENEPFKAQINSREKAREYISKHLPRETEGRAK
jgi:uncharacterized lipoprotein YehR (DUF1307 family)